MFGNAGFRMVENLRNNLLASLMRQEVRHHCTLYLHSKKVAYFDYTSPGSLISNLSSDTDKVGRLREVFPLILNPLAQVKY